MKVVNMGNIAETYIFDDLPATGITIEATLDELERLPNLAYKEVTIFATPRRNCDRPECATLEMATKTWIQEVFGPLCNNSKATMADIRTFDVWIYAPATDKEGGAE